MKVKKEKRWDDRVAISVCIATWIVLGLCGLYWEYLEFKSWLTLVM